MSTLDPSSRPPSAPRASLKSVPRDGFHAFMSYSHAADSQLAPVLERGLRNFALPFWQRLWRRNALRIFRDETTLAMTPHLWPTIEQALDTSQFFVLLASPEAARSQWVEQEVKHWLAKSGGRDRLLIVLTAGTLVWSTDKRDFDWRQTDCLPPALAGKLDVEPKWEDARPLKRADDLNARNPVLQKIVASLFAAISGRALDDVIGEDVSRQRQTRFAMVATAVAFAAVVAGGIYLNFAQLQQRLFERATSDVQTFAQSGATSGNSGLAAGLIVETLEGRPALLRSPDSAELRWSLVSTLPSLNERLVIGHDDEVKRVALHASGRTAATATTPGVISVWDIGHEQRLLARFAAGSEIAALEFSTDGQTVIAITKAGTRLNWAWQSKPGPTESPSHGIVSRAQIEPSSGRIAVLSADGSICVSPADGAAACPVRIVGPRRFADLKWRTDGQLQTVSIDGTLLSYSAAGGEPTSVLTLAADALAAMKGENWRVAVSPRGTRALTWLAPKTEWKNDSVLWDLQTGALLARPKGSIAADDRVTRAVFSPDDELLVLLTRSNASIWDTQTGKSKAYLFGHTGYIEGARFSPNGSQIVTWSYDQTARIWDRTDGRHLRTLAGHEGWLNAADFSPDGCTLVTASDDKTLGVWSLVGDIGGLRFSNVPCPAGVSTAVTKNVRANVGRFGRDDLHVITSSPDRQARVWRAADGALITELASRPRPPRAIATSADGRLIAIGEGIGDDDAAARLPAEVSLHAWQANAAEREVARVAVPAAVTSLSFSPRGTQLLAALGDGTALIWDLEASGRLGTAQTLKHGERQLNTAVWSHDGTRVITASTDKFACVWTLAKGLSDSAKRCLPKRNDQVLSAAWSTDDKRIVVGDGDSEVTIWDSHSLEPLAPTHRFEFGAYPLQVAFAPGDGPTRSHALGHIIVLLDNRELRVLETRRWRTIYSIGTANGVRSFDVSPDGRRLLTIHMDGSIRVLPLWLEAEELVSAVKTRIKRCLTTEQRRHFLGAQATVPTWCSDKWHR